VDIGKLEENENTASNEIHREPGSYGSQLSQLGGDVAVLDNNVERACIHQKRTDIHGEKSDNMTYLQTGMACKRPPAIPEQAVRHSSGISADRSRQIVQVGYVQQDNEYAIVHACIAASYQTEFRELKQMLM
jgi:hypothetical protein